MRVFPVLLFLMVAIAGGRASADTIALNTITGAALPDRFLAILAPDQPHTVPVLAVHPNQVDREKYWVSALAAAVNGKTEVRIPYGRVDLITQSFAIEVDWLRKWHEALGQALSYSYGTGRQAAFALVVKRKEWPLSAYNRKKLAHIARVARQNQVQVFLLIQAKASSPYSATLARQR